MTHHTTGEETKLTLGTFLPGIDELPEHIKPAAAMAARWQAEWLRLWARRAEAYLELPQKVLGCRDLGDIARVQTDFLDAMREHYTDCAKCAMNAGDEVPARHNGPDRGKRDTGGTPEQRKAA